MKNNKWMKISLFGVILLLAVGCVKEKSMQKGGEPGSPIVFQAATSYLNGEETRTIYSGYIEKTNRRERINWVPDVDKIAVNYKHGSTTETSEFTIVSDQSGSGTDAYKSFAQLSGTPLQWADGTDHTFYAMYPTNSFKSKPVLTSPNHFAGELLPTQDPLADKMEVTVDGKTWERFMPDMDYAFMVAYADQTANGGISGNSVTLAFRPAVTTLEFRLRAKDGETSPIVKKAEITCASKALVGKYSLDITGGDTEKGANWGDVTVPRRDANNSKVTVNFPAETTLPSASEDKYLDFTVFVLPHNKALTADDNPNLDEVSLTLTFQEGETRSWDLRAKNPDTNETKWFEFKGGNKYVITNSSVPGSTEWIYEVDPIPNVIVPVRSHSYWNSGLSYTVYSYKYNNHEPSKKYPVKWKLQYTESMADMPGDDEWIDVPSTAAATDPGNGTGNATKDFWMGCVNGLGVQEESDGSYTGQTGNAQIYNEVTDYNTEGDVASIELRRQLVIATPRGTMEAPFDLSKHPSYGNLDADTRQTTANCYIISAPGVYMFPCVYGNAITNGADNKSAYAPGSANDEVDDPNISTLKQVATYYAGEEYYTSSGGHQVYYTPVFYNAASRAISQPWIVPDLGGDAVSDLNAIVLWQDTPGKPASDPDLTNANATAIIPYPLSETAASKDAADDVEVITVGGNHYIRFAVDADHIRPGNFVIALRGGSNILWSWHIWVTPRNLSPTESLTNTVNGVSHTYSLMPTNLGWTDTDNGATTTYANRERRFRAIQVDDDGSTILAEGDRETFLVQQFGDIVVMPPSTGGNTYYQWGRKDPFLPSTPTGGAHEVYPYPYLTLTFNTDGSIKGENISTESLDYSLGIKNPHVPYYNIKLGDSNFSHYGTTSWIQGPAFAELTSTGSYYIKPGSEISGGWTLLQAFTANVAGLCDQYHWEQKADGLYYIKDLPYNYGPYTRQQAETMINGFNEPNHGFCPGLGFTWDSFSFTGGHVSAEQRALSACPSNLWNSYVYDEVAINPDNKFKTVYDPCPPGFTVPGKEVYIGEYLAEKREAGSRSAYCKYTVSPSYVFGGSASLVSGTGAFTGGLQAAGASFPYTGGRIFTTVSGSVILEPRGQGRVGFYWTDSVFRQDWWNEADQDPTNIDKYSFYHSAYALVFGYDDSDNYVYGNYRVQTYTKGSALSVRPIVDPKYRMAGDITPGGF